jgi:hypothetical protein
MRKALLLLLLSLAAAVAAPLAALAQGSDTRLAPSPAVQCLTPSPSEGGVPEFPFGPWKRGERGRVLAEFVFSGPDLAPAVTIVESEGDPELVAAVKTHARRLRVPCMAPGDELVRLRQDFAFEPDRRSAIFGRPVDLEDAARRVQMRCMARPSGSPAPEYPRWARRENVQGNVVAQLRFIGPDLPPEVKTHTVGRSMGRLAQDIEPWLAQMRMPCHAGRGPVTTLLTLVFRLESDVAGFRDLTFGQFLGLIKGLDTMSVDFDTREMGCPFDIQLHYLQPLLPNSVGQVGSVNPRREPLLDWLSTLVLDLNARQLEAAFGDRAKLTVPCGKLQLNPKEKS